MPEITQINAHYNRKVQLEQFEPIEHGVELQAEVGPDEDPDEAYEELANRAEELVEQEIARRLTQKKLAEDDDDEAD